MVPWPILALGFRLATRCLTAGLSAGGELDENPIEVGILHSLTGTMSISSLRTPVLALNLFGALAPVIFLGAIAYRTARNSSDEKFGLALTTAATQNARVVGRFVAGLRSDIEMIARNPALLEECRRRVQMSPDDDKYVATQLRMQKQLELILASYRSVGEVSIADPKTGRVLMSSNPSTVDEPAGDALQVKRMQRGETTLSPVHSSKRAIANEKGVAEVGVPTMVIGKAIAGEGEVQALLTLRVNLFALRDVLFHQRLADAARPGESV